MSSATALTIMAISMAVLAIVAILAVIFLTRLVMHLLAFEQTLVVELQEVRQLAAQLRDTTERVGQTVHDVQAAARRVGSAVGTVASLAALVIGRNTDTSPIKKLRPWLTGATIGWRLIRRRQKQHSPKNKAKEKKKRPAPIPKGHGTSLPL